MDLEAQAQIAFDASEAKNAQNDDTTNVDDTSDQQNNDQGDTSDVTATGDDTQDSTDAGNGDDDNGDDTNADDQAGNDAQADGDTADDDADATDDGKTDDTPPAFDPNSTLETFVYDGLPDITVVGKDGKEYTVKVPEELPEDFEFRNTREEKLFDQSMIRQSQNAEKLVGDYNQQQQVAVQQSYNQNLRSEIDEMVKAGRIPKFDGRKLNMEGKGEQRAQQVLDYMDSLNGDLAKAGKNYRIQSFEHALSLLEANETKAKLDEYQKSIDQGKKNVASLTPNASQSGGGSGGNKPAPMPRNMSATDFVSALDAAGEL